VNTVSDKIVRHLLDYLSVQKMVRVGHPLLRENLAKTDQRPSKRRSIFVRSASAVTQWKKFN